MAALTHDPHRQKRALWFLTVNVMAVVISVGVFVGVLHFDALSTVFEPLLLGVYEYKLVVIGIALSPLFASMLVGMAYAQRAIRRKKAESAATAS
jgi:ABC-type bacteriocin/lantibiotic exporter with double-glycine peptidase domain